MPKHVSSHAKKRLMERVGIKSDYGTLLNSIKKYGKTKKNFRGEFYKYLNSKDRGKTIKVFNDCIYIFSKSKKRLITTYKVPKSYLPISKYEIDNSVFMMLCEIRKTHGYEIKIILKNNLELVGYVVSSKRIPSDVIAISLKNGKNVNINAKDIVNFEYVIEEKESVIQ
uniref:hypothetical protein n=1 Tax=Candidatus Onthocola sp. TaxID=3085646 RepID=UPI003FEF82C4